MADLDDEPFVQVAREAKASYLVTYNVGDMQGVAQFDVQGVCPAEFLEILRKAV
jgi:predicted nucleic acid-binding protein